MWVVLVIVTFSHLFCPIKCTYVNTFNIGMSAALVISCIHNHIFLYFLSPHSLGTNVVFPGWRAVYQTDQGPLPAAAAAASAAASNTGLPAHMTVGTKFSCKLPAVVEEGETAPPPYVSMHIFLYLNMVKCLCVGVKRSCHFLLWKCNSCCLRINT